MRAIAVIHPVNADIITCARRVHVAGLRKLHSQSQYRQ
jgi:hypothetical protein